MNQVTLLGRVGQDPVHRTNSVYISLATSEYWKSKDNEAEYNKITQWHNVVFFNENLRDIVMENVTKGMRIQIQGKLSYSEYEKGGVLVKGVSVVAEDLIMLQNTNKQTDDEMLDAFDKLDRFN